MEDRFHYLSPPSDLLTDGTTAPYVQDPLDLLATRSSRSPSSTRRPTGRSAGTPPTPTPTSRAADPTCRTASFFHTTTTAAPTTPSTRTGAAADGLRGPTAGTTRTCAPPTAELTRLLVRPPNTAGTIKLPRSITPELP